MLDVELLKRANLTDMITAFKPGDLNEIGRAHV